MKQPDAETLIRHIRDVAASVGTARIMEVCGTHTVALFRSGIRSLLPENVRLISGPGCPVCVTSQGFIDAACELASREGITVCTYGDMVRVPGRKGSLADRRARGARVMVVYSARDALQFAVKNPDRRVVFLAVGFETTAPATAVTLVEADRNNVENFFVLTAHKRVVPAMLALVAGGEVAIDGFLCPGHVSVVIGSDAYLPVVEKGNWPCVVAGFEPHQMLRGILRLLEQISRDEAKLENVYRSAVSPKGNAQALAILDRVFTPAPAVWRAIGTIPDSGLDLREPFARFDARSRLDLEIGEDYDPPGCRCGEVIQGKIDPVECGLFGTTCSPAQPVGPCMVSGEGTCSAWYKYKGV